MPLTAYSISTEKELDVEQLLSQTAERTSSSLTSFDSIPDAWRENFRVDLECPSCFITGAEVVSEAMSRSSGKKVRQACFRFSSPGHHPNCDFASNDRANATPENLVSFSVAKSFLTQAVRELVCTGIELRAFNQRSIRDMREWFFHKKEVSLFEVTLDPRVPKWVERLKRYSFASSYGPIPPGVSLTAEITSLPGFDWALEARRRLCLRHKEVLDLIQQHRLWLHGTADRIETLAKRHHGAAVFDHSVLADEYQKTLDLAKFISRNYEPIRRASRNDDVAIGVLAFSALLLFVSGWNSDKAIAVFAAIAAASGRSKLDLGNVMGLNPFHDYQAWDGLKRLQMLNISVEGDGDLEAEVEAIELDIRSKYGS
jgi:hypothetical protein